MRLSAMFSPRLAAKLAVDSYARHNLRRNGLDRSLADARPVVAKPHNHAETWWLYRDIVKRKPLSVVELGCGYSTIAIRAALKANGAGQLLSLDANEDWVRQWEHGMPSDLASFGTIEICSLKQIEYQGTPAHCYDREPAAAIDYLFVDGPSPRSLPGWSASPMAADPVLWQPLFSNGARVVIEGRRQNTAFLQRAMPAAWRRSHTFPLRFTIFDREPGR
jgi:Methyltransferase domain